MATSSHIAGVASRHPIGGAPTASLYVTLLDAKLREQIRTYVEEIDRVRKDNPLDVRQSRMVSRADAMLRRE
jgi:hypothetical protein